MICQDFLENEMEIIIIIKDKNFSGKVIFKDYNEIKKNKLTSFIVLMNDSALFITENERLDMVINDGNKKYFLESAIIQRIAEAKKIDKENKSSKISIRIGNSPILLKEEINELSSQIEQEHLSFIVTPDMTPKDIGIVIRKERVSLLEKEFNELIAQISEEELKYLKGFKIKAPTPELKKLIERITESGDKSYNTTLEDIGNYIDAMIKYNEIMKKQELEKQKKLEPKKGQERKM
jgi:hypothetical protein